MPRVFIIAECPPQPKTFQAESAFNAFVNIIRNLRNIPCIANVALISATPILMPNLGGIPFFDTDQALKLRLGRGMPFPLPAIFYVACKEMNTHADDTIIAVTLSDAAITSAKQAGLANIVVCQTLYPAEVKEIERMILTKLGEVASRPPAPFIRMTLSATPDL